MAAAAQLRADEQFVTLGIDREVFAVPVTMVREILDMRPMFRIPEAPPHFAGLIDVRGSGVPVIDLRMRLGLPAVPPTDATRILVIEAAIGGRSLPIGVITDRVFEVAALDDGALEAAPDIGVRWRSEHIRGVGRRGDSFVVVFDLEQLLATDGDVLAGADAMAGEPA
jgi:purine-binding chemotaxis protein CheW